MASYSSGVTLGGGSGGGSVDATARSAASAAQSDIDGHTADTADAHADSAVTYTRADGSKKNIGAADDTVRAAVDKLDDVTGALSSLSTTSKTSVVSAINEVVTDVGTRLPKSGGTLTGNVTADAGVTIDGVDLSVDHALLTSIPIVTFTESWPINTNLKSATTVYVAGTYSSWCSRQLNTTTGAGGGPAVWEVDSNGKLHIQWAASTAAGSGNHSWIDTSLKGERIHATFQPTMVPRGASAYMEWGITGLILDAGQSNQVATNTFIIGPTFNLASTFPNETSTTEYHHIDLVLSLGSGSVNILFRETRVNSTSIKSTTAFGGSLNTGVDLKLRMTSAGIITAYYRATGGGSYTQVSGTVTLGDWRVTAYGVGTGNLSGTTGAGGAMDFRIDACTHTYVP